MTAGRRTYPSHMSGAAFALLTLMTLIPAPAAGGPVDPVERVVLSVRLGNHADVRESTLWAAQQQVSRIYASAGITVVWTANPSATRALQVLVLSYSMSDRMIRLEGIPRRVLGVANLDARRAYILTERVVDMANRVGVEPADALGNVIAHEIGHLLLTGSGHSSEGVMQPGYEFRNAAARWFTPEQAAVMRDEVRRRGE